MQYYVTFSFNNSLSHTFVNSVSILWSICIFNSKTHLFRKVTNAADVYIVLWRKYENQNYLKAYHKNKSTKIKPFVWSFIIFLTLRP